MTIRILMTVTWQVAVQAFIMFEWQVRSLTLPRGTRSDIKLFNRGEKNRRTTLRQF